MLIRSTRVPVGALLGRKKSIVSILEAHMVTSIARDVGQATKEQRKFQKYHKSPLRLQFYLLSLLFAHIPTPITLNDTPNHLYNAFISFFACTCGLCPLSTLHILSITTMISCTAKITNLNSKSLTPNTGLFPLLNVISLNLNGS
jgi:hypothetical protein